MANMKSIDGLSPTSPSKVSASRAAVRACHSPAFPTLLNKTRRAHRLPSHLPDPLFPVITLLSLHLFYDLSCSALALSFSRLSLSLINKIAHLSRKLIGRLNFNGEYLLIFSIAKKPLPTPVVISSISLFLT